MIKLRDFGLALAASLLFASGAGAATDTVETQIRQLETDSNAAYVSYYADDLRALFPEGPTTLPAYKKSWGAFIGGGGAIVAFKFHDMQVQVGPSGDTAVASYLASVDTRTPGKGVTTDAYAETDVWFKRNGEWKIVEIHYSETAPQK